MHNEKTAPSAFGDFKQVMTKMFDNGVGNIAIAVHPESTATATDLRADLVSFQNAINAGLTTEVESID